jgi:hypothetical protein
LFIVDLHNQGLTEDHAGRADLLASTRLYQCGAKRAKTCGF